MAGRETAVCLAIFGEFGGGEVRVIDNAILQIVVVLRSDFSGLGGAGSLRDFRIDAHVGNRRASSDVGCWEGWRGRPETWKDPGRPPWSLYMGSCMHGMCG